MSDQHAKKFPFEFQSLRPEEKAEFDKNFSVFFDHSRVGPKGYILSAGFKDDAENIYNMSIKSDDIIVYSFPRSGTTWTQELVWLLKKDLDYDAARSIPLTQRYIFLEFPSLLSPKAIDYIVQLNKSKSLQVDAKYLEDICKPASELFVRSPSPRFIKTHLPLSFLPPRTIDTAKVVYVARDPRDAAVSFYHLCKQATYVNFNSDFKTYWNLFTRNLILWTPFFDHLKEAWTLRGHPNMLFLFYEELTQDLSASILRVADFLGKQLSEEQIAELCDYLSFDNFKKNDSVNGIEMIRSGLLDSDRSFVRKGKAGGWRDYFDDEMSQEAERWIAENLRDTDLRFPHLH